MTIDVTTLDNLKKAMNDAIKKGDDTFTFDGDIFLVDYAKYLIEYLEIEAKYEDGR